MKKAQAPNQIFIYILAIVILAMILFFGYRAIADFGEGAQKVSYAQLQQRLTASINKIRSDYRSVSIEEFDITGKYQFLCFGEPGSQGQVPGLSGGPYALIYDSIASETGKNAFLYPEGTESFDVGPIDVDINGKDFGCIPAVGSKVKIRLEGLGDRTMISIPRTPSP